MDNILSLFILILINKWKQYQSGSQDNMPIYLWTESIQSRLWNKFNLPVGASLGSQNWDWKNCVLVNSIWGIPVFEKWKIAKILCQEKRQLMNFKVRTQYKLLNKPVTITTGDKINHFFQIFHIYIRRYCEWEIIRKNMLVAFIEVVSLFTLSSFLSCFCFSFLCGSGIKNI